MRQRLLCLMLAAGLAACHRGGAAADAGAADTAVVAAATAVATLQEFPQLIRAIGTVTPRSGRFAQLAAPAPTRVSRIFVAAGQHVAEGDSLIEFERGPFDAAAQSSEATLTSAQHAYARAVRLVQAGILPQKDSEQAGVELAEAQAAAVTARRAQQLATLRAPLAGVVTQMTAVMGASVDPSQSLVEVADPTALDIVFNVTPAEAARIQSGDAVTVTAGEGASGEALGEAVVATVGAAVDSATRAVAVRARIPRPSRPLRIGESLFGQIATAVHARAVTVPVAALVPAGDGYQVFVVDGQGVAHARPVILGARTETLIEIVSGLAAGETVVTSGAYGVSDGARITKTAPAPR